jgi:GNAT superfamily N-acetyltransferase
MNLSIEPIDARRDDLGEVAALSQRAFGRGFFETGIAPRLKLYESTASLIAARDLGQGALLGFCLCYMLPEHGLEQFLHGPDPDARGSEGALRDADESGTLGVIQTICVAPDLRGRGLARTLVQEAEIRLAHYSPSDVLAPAWAFDGGAPAGQMLDRLGYSKLLTVRRYWAQDCDEGSFLCPCRISECVCDMVLFWKITHGFGGR